MKRYLVIILVTFVLVPLALTACRGQAEESHSSQPRAAIVDQLYILEANPAFMEQATAALEAYGFTVDVWQGERITVGFYQELPRYGYELILFRVHSGILLKPEETWLVPSDTTYLFTGEEYTTRKYVAEQLTELVSVGRISEECPELFAVNSEFIKKDLNGSFADTVILMMGCETYYLDDMAEAFIQQGASVYLGWSTWISLEYMDAASLNLLGHLCTENLTVERGVAETMSEVGTDPFFHAYLKYSPAESGRKTISELIR